MRTCRIVTALIVGAFFLPQVCAAEPPLELEAKIPLGSVSGRIDHLAVDLGRQRLFVAELGNDSVGVVDLREAKTIKTIAGLRSPQGVGYLASADRLLVANAGDGSVRIFAGSDLTPAGRIELGDDADNIRIDLRSNRILIGYGNGGLAVIDPAAGNIISRIALKAHPEGFQIEPSGQRAFVNLPDAGEIAVADIAAGKQIASWSLRGARANFPMAIAAANERALVGFRRPSKLVAYRLADGAVVAELSICGDADDVFVDTRRRRVYVSCGEGAVDVLEERGSGYERIGRIPTDAGARTSLLVPELDRLFVAVRATPREPASIWVFRPTP